MPLESLVSMVLSPGNLALATRVNLAIARLAHYSAAAAVQHDRMWDAHRKARAARANKEFAEFRRLEGEAAVALHFYFVCWDAVAKTLSRLRKPPIGVGTPDRIYNRHQSLLKHYQHARNQFEHYDERLPLGDRSRDQYTKTDSGQSLSYELPFVANDGLVRYYGDQWDVGPESVSILRGIVDDFQQDLRAELRAIARKNIEGSHAS